MTTIDRAYPAQRDEVTAVGLRDQFNAAADDIEALENDVSNRQPLNAVLTALAAGTPLPVLNGGTGANMSATGGANQFVRQSTAGAAFTASVIANADIPAALTGKTYNGLTLTASTGTITVPNGATFATSGAYSVTLTATGTTSVTLPTTGTLATVDGSNTFTGTNTISTTAPEMRWRETDVAIASGGLWRIVLAGGELLIQRNTAAGGDFSSTNLPMWFASNGTGVAIPVAITGPVSTVIVTAAAHHRNRSYTVATLPAANAQEQIYVSDGTSNKRLAIADGTNWRWPDGAIVS